MQAFGADGQVRASAQIASAGAGLGLAAAACPSALSAPPPNLLPRCGRRIGRRRQRSRPRSLPTLPGSRGLGQRGRTGTTTRPSRSTCARRTPVRRTPRASRANDADFCRGCSGRREPTLSEARPRDAAALAALHGAAFKRGWSDSEFERLLSDRNVICHRATTRPASWSASCCRGWPPVKRKSCRLQSPRHARGRGLARKLSTCTCAGWPVSESARFSSKWTKNNEPARRLYRSTGFREVGRRESYYKDGAGSLGCLGAAPGPGVNIYREGADSAAIQYSESMVDPASKPGRDRNRSAMTSRRNAPRKACA